MIFPHHAPRSRKSRFYPVYRRLMIEIGRRAQAIISDTAASGQDVVRHLAIPPDRSAKVRAIHCGIDSRFQPGPEPASRKGGSPATFLYVGRADPYKNLVGLVEAFALLRKNCPVPTRLMMVGPRDQRYPEAPGRAGELGVADAVSWTGYLSDSDLVRAYQDAVALVLPSRYEGFGLPVLEAMACGTPVICGGVGALREIAGEAAIFVDPDDIPGMARQMQRVLTEPGLAADLRRRGLAQARQFSWRKTAEQTLNIYREVENQ